MDLGTIITGTIIILGCAIPLIIMNKKDRKGEQAGLQVLLEQAKTNNCNITKHTILNNIAIGIDEVNNVLFMSRKANNYEASHKINLNEFAHCRIINTGRSVNSKESSYKVIDKLELAFANKDRKKPDTVLEFYNTDYDNLTLKGELELVEQWHQITNSKLTAQQ